MEKRYTIGEISRITGISTHTLRYYDRIGIFKPEYVDPDKMRQNNFHPKGEYVDIYADEYRFADTENVLIIPEGAYVCYVTDVKEDYADFRALEKWLDQNGYTADFVIADEIGFQLFAYNQYFYPCEIKVLLSVT